MHSQSAKRADKAYLNAIKSSLCEEVILMSGGSASGKTEFMSEYLADKPSIILDGTLPTFEGARIKIRVAQKYGKKVRIVAVWPADLKVAFAAFLQRERKFPDEHFYSTHAQSRKALLEIAQSELKVEISLYENIINTNGLLFFLYRFDNRQQLIEELQDGQYTERRIIKIVTKP